MRSKKIADSASCCRCSRLVDGIAGRLNSASKNEQERRTTQTGTGGTTDAVGLSTLLHISILAVTMTMRLLVDLDMKCKE